MAHIETVAIKLKNECINQYKEIWGDTTADRLKDVKIGFDDLRNRPKGFAIATSGRYKNGDIIIILDDLLFMALDPKDQKNIMLHELAHCAVCINFGKFFRDDNGGHNEDWHYYVDELNQLPGINIVEVIDDAYAEKLFEGQKTYNKLKLFESILNEADYSYKAKVQGKWLKGSKLVEDKKDADTFESKTEPTQRINQLKKDGKLNKNAEPSIVKESKEDFFDLLLEDIEDFPASTRGMYRFARRRHNDTGAIRKVSKQPYWVHPEGVAQIVMEHGGSDIEIKAAMAHDVLEDTSDSYEDLVEKFGEKVASIVKEVTNDKDEIAKVGKEQYISEELVRLSPEALTVKLADMLYNMKDSPTEKNYDRMRKNVTYLMMNRKLSGVHLELADEIMAV